MNLYLNFKLLLKQLVFVVNEDCHRATSYRTRVNEDCHRATSYRTHHRGLAIKNE
jgi:hypothetical protein